MRFSPTITDLMTSPISAAHALVHHRVNTRPLLDVAGRTLMPAAQVVIDAMRSRGERPERRDLCAAARPSGAAFGLRRRPVERLRR